ncbi:ATP-binding protein [Sorangium sp. So ce128]|uniref:ATP-binding protein n=1 Tax=Sorangium sp. So ce128 TaxID=3133281 RepID=UPI003F60FA01
MARDIIDFGIERSRHERFFGREDVLAAIDRHLDGAGASGRWVLVTGGPGMGKSAILSRWLDVQEQRGHKTPHHFLRRDVMDWDRPDAVARSLSAQIEVLFPAQKDPEARPESRLIELLAKVSKHELAPPWRAPRARRGWSRRGAKRRRRAEPAAELSAVRAAAPRARALRLAPAVPAPRVAGEPRERAAHRSRRARVGELERAGLPRVLGRPGAQVHAAARPEARRGGGCPGGGEPALCGEAQGMARRAAGRAATCGAASSRTERVSGANLAAAPEPATRAIRACRERARAGLRGARGAADRGDRGGVGVEGRGGGRGPPSRSAGAAPGGAGVVARRAGVSAVSRGVSRVRHREARGEAHGRVAPAAAGDDRAVAAGRGGE